MSKSDDNYSTSIPPVSVPDFYPCVASGIGRARFGPGEPYPLRLHALDYPYDWSQGRTLQAFQIIYITHGTGTFRSGAEPKQLRIEAGSAVLLFPGVWHHYTPDTKTGWTEHWIECKGAAFEQALERGTLRRERPVLRMGMNHSTCATAGPGGRSLRARRRWRHWRCTCWRSSNPPTNPPARQPKPTA
jgi:hypothetical protein